jgi:glycosyltransferase involved in cell wall biosynthesis
VVADAGMLVDPTDVNAFADALDRAIFDREWALTAAHAGLRRSQRFTWQQSAHTLHGAYVDAVARRQRSPSQRSGRG